MCVVVIQQLVKVLHYKRLCLGMVVTERVLCTVDSIPLSGIVLKLQTD